MKMTTTFYKQQRILKSSAFLWYPVVKCIVSVKNIMKVGLEQMVKMKQVLLYGQPLHD